MKHQWHTKVGETWHHGRVGYAGADASRCERCAFQARFVERPAKGNRPSKGLVKISEYSMDGVKWSTRFMLCENVVAARRPETPPIEKPAPRTTLRIRLASFDVSREARAAIAGYYGDKNKLATREQIERFCNDAITGAIDDILSPSVSYEWQEKEGSKP